MTVFGPIDDLLSRALCGPAPWPADTGCEAVKDRALYHGIAALLIDKSSHIADWPEALRDSLRRQALSQAMWEMRHRLVLTRLLDAFDQAGVHVRVLKGTAIAYAHYPEPALRARGDTDLLIAPGDLETARSVLQAMGFACFYSDDEWDGQTRLQEPWTLRHAGETVHEIDLHWAVWNSPFLNKVLSLAEIFDLPCPLPQLGSHGFTPPDDIALLYACIHRAIHVISPYFVDGHIHYGGDRLIWLVDVDLLWRALDEKGRARLAVQANKRGGGQVVAKALFEAAKRLGTPVPETYIATLRSAPVSEADRYLAGSSQVGRAYRNLASVSGLHGKAKYLWTRLVPPRSFIRSKYVDMANKPIALLYLRRFLGFWRNRTGQNR